MIAWFLKYSPNWIIDIKYQPNILQKEHTLTRYVYYLLNNILIDPFISTQLLNKRLMGYITNRSHLGPAVVLLIFKSKFDPILWLETIPKGHHITEFEFGGHGDASIPIWLTLPCCSWEEYLSK